MVNVRYSCRATSPMQEVMVVFNSNKLQDWIPKTWLKTLQNRTKTVVEYLKLFYPQAHWFLPPCPTRTYTRHNTKSLSSEPPKLKQWLHYFNLELKIVGSKVVVYTGCPTVKLIWKKEVFPVATTKKLVAYGTQTLLKQSSVGAMKFGFIHIHAVHKMILNNMNSTHLM